MISSPEAVALASPILGLPVSQTWRGYGSAIFLDCGKLTTSGGLTRRGRGRRMRGEIRVMIEWSWRVEKARSIQAGSWSTNRRINAVVASLKGPTVKAVRFDGELPELTLLLSDGRRVKSFMTERPQPAWTLFLSDDSWITVHRGRLVHDTQNQRTPDRRRAAAAQHAVAADKRGRFR